MTDENKKQLDNFLYNVKWLREHNGLSKKHMTKLLGIGVASLNKIENGELPIGLSSEVLARIQYHFGIHPADQFKDKLGD